MAQRQAQQQQSLAPLVILAGVAGGGYAVYMRYPGVAAVWLALLAASWMEPPAILTGKKDSSGFPTPAHPGEKKRLGMYRFWQDLRWKLVLPSSAWLPGWPIFGAWITGVVLAAGAAMFPVADPRWRIANAAAAFLMAVAPAASRRRTSAEGDSPGVRIDTLPAMFTNKLSLILVIAGTAVITVASGWAASTFLPDGLVPWKPGVVVFAAAAGFLLCAAGPWSTTALAHWRIVVAARGEWEPRWQALKQDPSPFLIDRQQVGQATVDTFDAPSSAGSMAYLPLAPKIAPTVGAGSELVVLDVCDIGADGPMPGTRHPLRFEIVTFQAGEVPSPADAGLSQEEVELLVRAGMVRAVDSLGYARPVLNTIEAISTPESPAAAWRSMWDFPLGPSMTELRKIAGDIAGGMGCDVLVAHRENVLYCGALLDDEVEFVESDVGKPFNDVLGELNIEDEWNSRWAQVLKQDANPPTIQHAVFEKRKLADGTDVFRQPWMTRKGIDPMDFFGLESKLATALDAAPFVAISGWPERGDRPGERHAQAFVTYWSEMRVPASPERLPPAPAADWVLTGVINQAFVAARLARPEIVKAQALTKKDSAGHIWRIELRLYGGITLSDVRGQSSRLRQAMGVTWLRVEDAEDGCVIYVGVDPVRADLVNPRRDRLKLAELDWAQSWIDSGVSGVSGLVPKLTGTGVLPKNEVVEVLDFALPPGVDPSKVNSALPKLRNATGNEFIEVRPGPDASTMRLLVSKTNPLPTTVPPDFDEIDASDGIPFATNVEGEPVVFRTKDSPHALIAGLTGAGKSVLAQMILYGALVRGWRCYVIDSVKEGADFTFAKDRCVAFAGTNFQAAGLMKEIYKEVLRRKSLNAKHGVGSYKDLPDEVRPPHIAVMIDEFTSLLGQEPLPKASGDLTMDADRDRIEAENFARLEVGSYAGKIAREARSAGVTLLLATQKLNAKMLDAVPGGSDLKTNMARTLLGKASFGDRASALRNPDDAPRVEGEVGQGRGLWEPVTSAAEVMQVWYAEPDVYREELVARVPELPDEDRVDVSRFGPPDDQSVPPPTPTVASRVADEDEMVDVGEIEFSLDGLDFDADEGSEVAGGVTVGVPDFVDVDVDESDTVLFVDVDGVLSPIGSSGSEGWGDWVLMPGGIGGDMWVSLNMADTLAGFEAQRVWLTSWEGSAEETFGPIFGWDGMDVLGVRDTGGFMADHEWWKLAAARTWLSTHPGVRKVIWFDDELGTLDADGVSYADRAVELLVGDGYVSDNLALMAPDPDQGVSPFEVITAADIVGVGVPEIVTGRQAEPLNVAVDESVVVDEPSTVVPPPPVSVPEVSVTEPEEIGGSAAPAVEIPVAEADEDDFATPRMRVPSRPVDDDEFAKPKMRVTLPVGDDFD